MGMKIRIESGGSVQDGRKGGHGGKRRERRVRDHLAVDEEIGIHG